MEEYLYTLASQCTGCRNIVTFRVGLSCPIEEANGKDGICQCGASYKLIYAAKGHGLFMQPEVEALHEILGARKNNIMPDTGY